AGEELRDVERCAPRNGLGRRRRRGADRGVGATRRSARGAQGCSQGGTARPRDGRRGLRAGPRHLRGGAKRAERAGRAGRRQL
ncbi:MAG: hypothetical protein AVDCRST_MAG53-1103, partial [uncultured Solirubrobacteraceae bacterium]